MKAPEKLAFLVGVSDYGSSAKDLEFCVNDIHQLAEVLARKGFRCEKWINQSLTEILDARALENFIKSAATIDDVVLFYFSGHGEDLGGEQLLLGKGVQRANMNRALVEDDVLLLSRVLSVLSELPAQKILVIDACRVPSLDQRPAPDLYKERTQAIQSLKNCAVVFASADGKESFGTPNNSASRFTLSLTEEFKPYGRGLLSVIAATINRVSQYNDGKSQTPWVYASLQERVLDGFSISDQKLQGTNWPRCINGDTARGVWSTLSGSNALAKYETGTFIPKARLPDSLMEGLMCFDSRPQKSEYVFVRARRATLTLVCIGNITKWTKNTVTTRTIGAGSMTSFFGALWSRSGHRLLAFGTPVLDKIGIKIWNFADPNKQKSESVQGIPADIDCNAAAWINEDQILASFCRDVSSRSHIYLMETDGQKWKASLMWMTPTPLRITSIAVSNIGQFIYLGCDDGSVAVGDMSSEAQPTFIPREHASSGLNYIGPVPWTGANRTEDSLNQLGVVVMAEDAHTGLLGITYLDGSAAFLDPVLGTYVRSLTLRGRPRRPHIACVSASTLLSEGEQGLLFEIRKC